MSRKTRELIAETQAKAEAMNGEIEEASLVHLSAADRGDLMYLKALVDSAPRVIGNFEGLTDNWRGGIQSLIAALMEYLPQTDPRKAWWRGRCAEIADYLEFTGGYAITPAQVEQVLLHAEEVRYNPFDRTGRWRTHLPESI